jgi:hypothetical protein
VLNDHNRYKGMSTEFNAKIDPDESMIYQIRIKGHLGSEWADWFGGVSISLEANGDTLLTSSMIDQAALHGLLKRVRDLGTPLISVLRVEAGEAGGLGPGQTKSGDKS